MVYFVSGDAKDMGMKSVLWFILVIIPRIRYLFPGIHVVFREIGCPGPEGEGKSARAIRDERYAREEITNGSTR